MPAFVPDLTVGYDLVYANLTTISTDTDTDSAAIDLQDYEGPVHVLALVGNYGDASTVSVIKLRQSTASAGTYADITGATKTLSASASANDSTGHFLRVDNWSARYVKVRVTTSGGGTPSVPIALGILARKKVGTGTSIQTSI